VTLAYTPEIPTALRIVENTARVPANAFSWDNSQQCLSISEWLTRKEVTIEITVRAEAER
jgi:hypothetical protein